MTSGLGVMKRTRPAPALALSILAGVLVVTACGRAPAVPSSPRAEEPASSAAVAAPAVAEIVPPPRAASSASSSPPAKGASADASSAKIFLEAKDPSGGFPEIIAVDAEKRRVWVRRDTKDDTARIHTVDVAAGKIVETWDSDPKRRLELTGFKRLAFQKLSGVLADDLARYAQIVARADERTILVPSMSVAADRSTIAFLVKAGPRLQVAVADAEGKHVRTVGTPTMRGEHPSVSPDGRWLAFSGCDRTATTNDCPRSLFVVDLRDPKLAPRKLPVAWPAALAWDADSRGLSTTEAIALARASGVPNLRRSCLLHVNVEPGDVTPIVCAEGVYDTQLAVSPNRLFAAFFVSRDQPPDRSFDVRTCALSQRTCAAPAPIPQLVAPPSVTDEGIAHASALEGDVWSQRLDPREAHLVGDVGWPAGAVPLDAKTLVRTVPVEGGYAVEVLAATAPVVKQKP